MEQYQIGNATVRINGNPDMDNLKVATTRFLKQVETKRKKVRNEARTEANRPTAEVASEMEA